MSWHLAEPVVHRHVQSHSLPYMRFFARPKPHGSVSQVSSRIYSSTNTRVQPAGQIGTRTRRTPPLKRSDTATTRIIRQCLQQASNYFKTCSGDQYAADGGGFGLKTVDRGWHFGDMTCIMGIEACRATLSLLKGSLVARDCACSFNFLDGPSLLCYFSPFLNIFPLAIPS